MDVFAHRKTAITIITPTIIFRGNITFFITSVWKMAWCSSSSLVNIDFSFNDCMSLILALLFNVFLLLQIYGADNTNEILELFTNVWLVHNTNKLCHFSALYRLYKYFTLYSKLEQFRCIHTYTLLYAANRDLLFKSNNVEQFSHCCPAKWDIQSWDHETTELVNRIWNPLLLIDRKEIILISWPWLLCKLNTSSLNLYSVETQYF